MEYKQILLFFMSMFGSKAYTPIGYLGCFEDTSTRNLDIILSTSDRNSGDECKRRCSSRGYRYAGTKNARQCHCGTRIKDSKQTTGCVMECTGRNDEKCGGHMQISIYDTWQCVKKPCANNATCKDIHATRYTCSCRDGWEGENCTMEVPTKSPPSTTVVTTTIRPTNRAISKTSVVNVTTYSAETPAPTSTPLPNTYSGSSNITESTTYARPIDDTESSVSLVIIYILAPVGLIVMVAAIVISISVIRRRRKRSIEREHNGKDNEKEYIHYDDISASFSQSYCTVNGNKDSNVIQLRSFQDSSRNNIDLYTINSRIIRDNAVYITPCYGSKSDLSDGEYTYIDETRLSNAYANAVVNTDKRTAANTDVSYTHTKS